MADGEGAREAFSLLAHDIRLDILRAFFDHWREVRIESASTPVKTRPLSYSELMDAVGMRDSGKFNYHLEKVRGVYVEQADDGYVLTASAIALYRAVVANRPTTRTSVDIETACPACGAGVVGRYEREFLVVECSECTEWRGLTYPFPKNGLSDRSGGEIFSAVRARAHSHVRLAQSGQCPSCAGTTTITFHRERLDGDRSPTVEIVCSTCSWFVDIDILQPLRFEPQVVAALAEIGVYDTADGYTAEAITDLTGRVQSDDPLRVAVAIETSDGTATVVVDDTLDVVSVSVE